MLFLLQEGPAETLDFMIAGYVVIFSVMLIYLVSLIVRRRNLQRDLEILKEIEAQESADAPEGSDRLNTAATGLIGQQD
ncbi:MAG: hypothetical protein GX495_10190 [Chloroflexi bacterium]|jgi:CcmD family protein|nr:hypothetical protein [Chloroflexota bacterium]